MDTQLSKFLDEYIERMRPRFSSLPQNTAHEIASAFLAFRYSLYSKAVLECASALGFTLEGDAGNALKKALVLVKRRAEDLDSSQITTDSTLVFTETERQYIAIDLSSEKTEDPATLELDNALVLLYAVAITTSPDDGETLDEHRKYIITLLSPYKNVLRFR